MDALEQTKYTGQRYEKQFCTYSYVIGGNLLYETLHANLKNMIPSPRVVREIEDN